MGYNTSATEWQLCEGGVLGTNVRLAHNKSQFRVRESFRFEDSYQLQFGTDNDITLRWDSAGTQFLFRSGVSTDIWSIQSDLSMHHHYSTRHRDNIPAVFGTDGDLSIGYHSAGDELQIVDGSVINSNVLMSFTSTRAWVEAVPLAFIDNQSLQFGAGLDVAMTYNATADAFRVSTISNTILDIHATNNRVILYEPLDVVDDNRITFGSGNDYSAGYNASGDEFRVTHADNLTSNVAMRVDSDRKVTVDRWFETSVHTMLKEKSVSDNTLTTLATLLVPTGESASGVVYVEIEVTNGSAMESISSERRFAAANQTGTVGAVGGTQATNVISKTHGGGNPTLVITIGQSLNVVYFQVTCNTALTGATLNVKYHVRHSNGTVAFA